MADTAHARLDDRHGDRVLYHIVALILGVYCAVLLAKIQTTLIRRLLFWITGFLSLFIVGTVMGLLGQKFGTFGPGRPEASGVSFVIGLTLIGWLLGTQRSAVLKQAMGLARTKAPRPRTFEEKQAAALRGSSNSSGRHLEES